MPHPTFHPTRPSPLNARSHRATATLTALIMAHGLATLSGVAQDTHPAAPAGGTTKEVRQLPPVVVSGAMIGSKTNAVLLPGSSTYLDTADITRHSYTDINRVVRQVPGVYVREEDGYGLFQNLSLRGVDPGRSGKVTLMEDGVLAAPAPYSGPSAYYSPNVGRMSGLEILKGSSQVKYGPHITGGAINYLSTPIPDQERTFLKAYYGSYNEIFTHAWHGDSLSTENAGRFGYLFEGFYQETDGFKTIDSTPDFSDRHQTGFHRVEPMLKFFWEPPTDTYHRFEFKYGYTEFDADETYLGLNSAEFGSDPYRRYAASRFDNIDTYHHRAYLRHIMEPADNLRITTTGYYNKFHRNWEKLNELVNPGQSLGQALEDTTPGGGLDILRGQAAGDLRVRNNYRDYYMAGVQSAGLIEFETGEVEHELEAGVRYHFDEMDRFQWDVTYNQAANGTITGATTGARGAAGDRIEQSHAIAFHVQDSIRINKLTLTPGLRYETIQQEFEQNTRRTDGATPSSGDGDLDALGGGLGAAYELNPEWSVFGGAYRGFSIPGPSGTINNDLEEETSLSLEVGARYQGRNGLRAEAVYFHTDFSDLIVGDNIAATGSTTTENVGDIDVNGVELLLGYDPGQALEWAIRTPMSLAFTYTDARLDGDTESADPESIFSGGEDGNRVPYIPEYQVSAQVGAEYDKAGLYLTGTYVPATYSTASNTSQPIDPDGTPDARFGKTDSYFLLDVTARYRFREQATLFAGIRNLLDREYVASRHPHGPRPGLPRVFNVGVEVAF